MSDLTPLKIAKDLEFIVDAQRIYSIGSKADSDELYHSLELAASYLRAIAAGEYKQVVHAHWIPVAKECYDVTDDEQYPAYKYCSHCRISQKWPDHFKRCPECGALMDESDMRQTQGGKDDSHAKSDT